MAVCKQKKVKSVKKSKRTKKLAKSTHAILIVHSFSSMPCQLESHITDVLSLRFLDFKSIYFGILPNEKKDPQKNEKKNDLEVNRLFFVNLSFFGW